MEARRESEGESEEGWWEGELRLLARLAAGSKSWRNLEFDQLRWWVGVLIKMCFPGPRW